MNTLNVNLTKIYNKKLLPKNERVKIDIYDLTINISLTKEQI